MESPSGLLGRGMPVASGGGNGRRAGFRPGLSNGAGLRVRFQTVISIRNIDLIQSIHALLK